MQKIDNAHWSNRQSGYQNFPVSDQLFEALKHRPKPGKDISNLTFGEYLKQMDPFQSTHLCLDLQRIRIQYAKENLIQICLAKFSCSEAEAKQLISQIRSIGKEGAARKKQRDQEKIKKQVLEMAQTTHNISQIARVCGISRGSVSKILKNRPQ